MTVKELTERLQNCPQDSQVIFFTPDTNHVVDVKILDLEFPAVVLEGDIELRD